MTAQTSPAVASGFALILTLTLSGLFPSALRQSVRAQIGERAVGVRAGTVSTLPAKDKRWALIIGIDEYEDSKISPLKGAVKDARTLHDALIKYAGFPKEQIILLTSSEPPANRPRRINILSKLSQLQGQVPKDGLLLVAFSGHGIDRGGRSYLIPMDGQDLANVDLMEEAAINVDKVRLAIEATQVSQVIFVLDACRNDPSAGRSGSADNVLSDNFSRGFDFHQRNKNVQAFVTLYATRVKQRAYEYAAESQGYFTYALVEALSGAAKNDKGEVTLSSLVGYVEDKVPRYVKRDLGDKEQVPWAAWGGYKAAELVLAKHAPKVAAVVTPPPVAARPAHGNLAVSCVPGASVSVLPVGWSGPTNSGVVSSGDRTYRLPNLPPGRYRITASLAGYREAISEVELKAGEALPVTLNLAPIKYKVSFTTDVGEGVVKLSAPGESARLMPYQSGRADLGELAPGVYDVEITAKEVGYKPISERLSVTGDVSKHYTFTRNLSRMHYSASAWKSLEDWTAPTGWVAASGRLSVKGSGVAVLSNENYSNYADCKLTADVKFVNGVGIAFVARYTDPKNYYYIHISGSRGDTPYMLRGYLVKDGVTKRIYSNSVDWLAQHLRPDQPIRLIIELHGSAFKVSMDSDGEVRPMGEVIDPNNALRSGAVGIAALGNEQTEVFGFIISPEGRN